MIIYCYRSIIADEWRIKYRRIIIKYENLQILWREDLMKYD